MANHVIRGLKEGVKRFAHASGGFPAYHALRNDRALTVLTFHRILPPSDPRAHDADPDWTLSVDQFVHCLAFAREHFNVVALDDVLEARRQTLAPLPPKAVLLTFDDGWADNEQHALPILEAEKMPAVIFVSSDAVGMQAPFWRERLRLAWRGGRLDHQIWKALWNAIAIAIATGSSTPNRSDETFEELLAGLSAHLTRAQRDEVLAPWTSRLDDGQRHMMSPEEVKRVHEKGIAIGAHGRTHEPLSRCEDLDDELEEPRRRLGELLGVPISTLALPHNRFTPDVLHRAERAGYEMVFTGVPELTPTRVIPFSVGRIPITPGALSDEQGRFRPERLALHLFRRPHIQAWA